MSNHDVFLAPEITMQEGGAAIDYEDDEDIIEEEEDEVTAYASNNGATAAGYNVFGLPGSELPPEISITKVDRSKQQAASTGGQRRPPIIPKAANGRNSGGMAATNGGGGGGNFLKVRNDLGGALPPQASVAGPRMPGFNGGALPPPLLKIGGQGGLPPMPKLKFGGPARPVRMPPRAPNPLAGMFNMSHGMIPPPGMPTNIRPLPGGFAGIPPPGMFPPAAAGPPPSLLPTSSPSRHRLPPPQHRQHQPHRHHHSPPTVRAPMHPAGQQPRPPPSTTSLLRQQRMPNKPSSSSSSQQQPQASRPSNFGLSKPAAPRRSSGEHAASSPLAQLERQVTGGGKVSRGQPASSLPPFINPNGKPRVASSNGGSGTSKMPLSAKTGVGGLKSLSEVVQVPPPLSSKQNLNNKKNLQSNSSISKASLSSVSAQQQLLDTISNNSPNDPERPPRSFPELNITVKTVPKQVPKEVPPSTIKGRKLSELDDLENELERELEELDDVEPEDMFHFGAAAAAAAATANTTTLDEDEPPALPVRRPTESPVKTPEKKLEALKFVRRADGKGFVRKGGSSVNKGGLSTKIRVSLKTKSGGGNKSKKKKKPFRGGNYRFDGTAIKKRPAPKKSDTAAPAAIPFVSGVPPQPVEKVATSVDIPSSPAAPQPSVLEYLGIHRKGSNDDSSPETAPQVKKIKDSSEVISQSKTSWDWYKKGSNDDCLPDPAAKVKKIKDSTEIISQQSTGAPATAAAGVKRKSGASVGVHESGLAFLRKVKLEVAATAAAGHPVKASSLAEEPEPVTNGVVSNGGETLASVEVNTSSCNVPDAETARLINGLGPRKAKQLAQEATEKVLKAGSLQSVESWQKSLSGAQSPAAAATAQDSEQLIDIQNPCVCFCDVQAEDLKPAPAEYRHKKPHCQAIESVGGSRVGCKNKVTDFRFRRTSIKASGSNVLLCDAHIKRLKAHQACVFCGEFCAHGIFMLCRPSTKSLPHLFHRNCFMASKTKQCPHCKCTEKPITVQLRLQMDRMPVSLLNSVSKMTLGAGKKAAKAAADSKAAEPSRVSFNVPGGKVISSARLPEGVGDEALAKVIEALEDKDNVKHTTRNMYIPCKAGDNVKLMQLLSLGYSPNQRFTEAEGGNPLHVAASEGHVLTAHILVQAGAELDALDDEQNTPLMLACHYGQGEVVKYLLQAGADMTLKGDDGMTCLHLATQNGHLACAESILNQKDMPRKFLNSQDEGGWTPLVWACENKHEKVIEFLLTRGADPLITDAEGNIAIHWGALSGSRPTCELLLNYGCSVNTTNNLGESPMHIALRQDHYECAVLFLMRGANLNIDNKDGKKPVDLMTAKDAKCRTIVRLTTLLQSLMKDTKQNYFERIVSNDITNGKESLPIQCVNDLDYEGVPTNYVYVTSNCVTSNIPIDRSIATLQHCNCTDKCSSEDSCNCSDLSVKSWYDMDGRLKEDFDYNEPPMIFECNEMCKCNVNTCNNRVLQHGITARLQVFRAYGMGWGVRAAHEIPKGSFVCEYVGEIISDSEAETREDSYLFDLESRDGDTFCIDANRYRNITGLINHLCTPNLTPVKVFTNHQDLRFPHIAMFANRNIKKGEELGFDYGEKFWVIKHKQFTCHCTSDKCRYNKSNIHAFLKEYYKRNGEEPQTDSAKKTPAASAVKTAETKSKSSPAPAVAAAPAQKQGESDHQQQQQVRPRRATRKANDPETASNGSSGQ